jgi:hypothetical protein
MWQQVQGCCHIAFLFDHHQLLYTFTMAEFAPNRWSVAREILASVGTRQACSAKCNIRDCPEASRLNGFAKSQVDPIKPTDG